VVFQVSDGVQDAAKPGVFSIMISNSIPVAQTATAVGQENQALAGKLAATDSDLPAQAMTFTIVTNANKGSVIITNTTEGGFIYTPAPNRFGTDSFSFKVSDGIDESKPVQINLLIRPILRPGRLLLTRAGSQDRPGSIEAVDPGTKDMMIISMSNELRSPFGLAVETTGKVLATDNNGGVFRIDPATGALAPLVSKTELPSPLNLALESTGNILVTDMSRGLLRFNPEGALLSVFPRGSIELASGVAVAPSGEIFLNDAAAIAGNPMGTEVLRVNPQTLVSTTITSNNLLRVPVGLVIERNDSLLVMDVGNFMGQPDSLVRINADNGELTLVTSSNLLNASLGITIEQSGMVFVACGDGSIVAIDPETGEQRHAVPPMQGQLNGIAAIPGAIPLPSIISIKKGASGVEIRAAGLPGRRYELRRAAAPTSPEWTRVDAQETSSEGILDVRDASPLEAAAFYRLRMR
jgi:outer membrane protein assembly factor BamB